MQRFLLILQLYKSNDIASFVLVSFMATVIGVVSILTTSIAARRFVYLGGAVLLVANMLALTSSTDPSYKGVTGFEQVLYKAEYCCFLVAALSSSLPFLVFGQELATIYDNLAASLLLLPNIACFVFAVFWR